VEVIYGVPSKPGIFGIVGLAPAITKIFLPVMKVSSSELTPSVFLIRRVWSSTKAHSFLM